jgi:hypothetical protein
MIRRRDIQRYKIDRWKNIEKMSYKPQRAKRVCMTETEIERKKERRERARENERKKFSAVKRERER